jgi:hypothetical protein
MEKEEAAIVEVDALPPDREQVEEVRLETKCRPREEATTTHHSFRHS